MWFVRPNIRKMLNDKNVIGLGQALCHKSSSVRRTAAAALGEMYSQDSDANKLLCQATHDESKDVRVAAATALGKMGHRVAGERLGQMLSDEDAEVRTAAARALLGDADLWDTNSARRHWDKFDYLDALRSALKDNCEEVRGYAIQALDRTNDAEDIDPLQAINDRSSGMRQSAVRKLSRIDDARALEALCHALNDRCGDVRKAAIETLGAIADARAIEPLCRVLASDTELQVPVIRALAKIATPEALEVLCHAVETGNEAVQIAAVDALGLFKVPEVADILCRAAQARSEVLRVAAIRELRGFREPKVLDVLCHAAHEKSEAVQIAAIDALGRFQEPRAADILCQTINTGGKEVRAAAVRALANQYRDPRGNLEVLCDWADSDGNHMCAEAVSLCDRISDARIREEFSSICSDHFRGQVKNAISALSHSPEAIEPLCRACSKGFNQGVIFAIRNVGDDRAIIPLCKMLAQCAAQLIENFVSTDYHERQMKAIEDALANVLDRTLAKAKVERLRYITGLPDTFGRWFSCGYVGYVTNFARFKQLARQELIRRGMKV